MDVQLHQAYHSEHADFAVMVVENPDAALDARDYPGRVPMRYFIMQRRDGRPRWERVEEATTWGKSVLQIHQFLGGPAVQD